MSARNGRKKPTPLEVAFSSVPGLAWFKSRIPRYLSEKILRILFKKSKL